MADIDVNIYEAVTNRDGVSTPVSGVISGDPLPNPLNPTNGTNQHNSLEGLQGGASGQYYHINQDQWDAVDNANAPDAGNPFATMADVGGGSDPNKVSYNVADGKTASERRQARDNINVSSGIPQTIATTGTLTVTRTSNCLVFTGAGAVRLDTVTAGLDGEEIIVINLTGQSMDINSTGSTVDSFSSGIGLRNGASAVFRYFSSRWNQLDSSPNLTSSAAATINSYPLRVYKSDGTTEIFAVRSQGNVYVTGLGSTSLGTLTVRQDTSGSTRQAIRVENNSGTNVIALENGGTIFQARSSGAAYSVRRDELPYNYPQTVATAGTINNLSLTDEGIKLLILTAATDLTGVVPVSTTTGRLLRIEGRVGGGVIIRHESASSTAANRFTLSGAVDLTIANGEVYTFIYTNGRWRRAL